MYTFLHGKDSLKDLFPLKRGFSILKGYFLPAWLSGWQQSCASTADGAMNCFVAGSKGLLNQIHD